MVTPPIVCPTAAGMCLPPKWVNGYIRLAIWVRPFNRGQIPGPLLITIFHLLVHNWNYCDCHWRRRMRMRMRRSTWCAARALCFIFVVCLMPPCQSCRLLNSLDPTRTLACDRPMEWLSETRDPGSQFPVPSFQLPALLFRRQFILILILNPNPNLLRWCSASELQMLAWIWLALLLLLPQWFLCEYSKH